MTLDRRRIDQIARAVVDGSRGLDPELDRLADLVAAESTFRLAAVGAAGARRARQAKEVFSPGDARASLSPEVLARLRDRTAKLLADCALKRAHEIDHDG